MTSKTDTQEARATSVHHDEHTETDLAAVNRQLADQPSADLHRRRLQLLDEPMEAVAMVRESLDWLAAHDVEAFTAARAELASHVQAKLDFIQAGERFTSYGDTPRSPHRVIEQLEPLADYFPAIHLSYGHLLIQETRPRSFGEPSPLERLEDLLAGKDAGDAKGDRAERERQRAGKLAKARDHLGRAVALLEAGDPHRGEALDALGQVCERLMDLPGAYRAYREAHERYGHDHVEKLQGLEPAIGKLARHRALTYLDELLGVGDLEAASALLDRLKPPLDDAEFRVRAADLALLRGDLDSAHTLYDDLMEVHDAAH